MAKGPGGIISGGFDPLNAPDAPTIDSVSAGVLTADVTFSAPDDTGAGTVDSYVITAKQSDGTGVSATASAAGTTTVTLTAGGTTTFAAQAISDEYGPGAFSGFGNSTSVFTGQELYAWGNNDDGPLGQNTPSTADTSSPVQVGALTNWASGDVTPDNQQYVIAIDTSGELYAWGDNGKGQLGLGNVVSRSSPVQVGALTNWSQVSSGVDFNAATKTDGTLWTWGINSSGRLGDGTTTARSSPVQVGGLTDWSQVSAGEQHCLAVKTDGTLWAWGNAGSGRLGNGTDSPDINSPIQIGSETYWAEVLAAKGTSWAKDNLGNWYVWGANSTGVYGNNTEGGAAQYSSPVQVSWIDIDSLDLGGTNHVIAIKPDGSLFAWGAANDGRLGNNTTTPNKSSPVQIGALTNWSKSACGQSFSLATKTDGTLWAWGRNAEGELGDGTTIDKSSPIQVGSDTSWTDVKAGYEVSIAFIGITS